MSNFALTSSFLSSCKPSMGTTPSSTRLFKTLMADLSKHPEDHDLMCEWLEDDDVESFLGNMDSQSMDTLTFPFQGLSWFDEKTTTFSFYYTQANQGSSSKETLFGTRYGVAWLDITLGITQTPNIPASRLSDVHERLVQALIGDNARYQGHLRDDMVLFVTLSGKGYTCPELYVAGPAALEGGHGERTPGVRVKRLPFNRDARQAEPDAHFKEHLQMLTSLDAKTGSHWREAFEHDFSTLTKIQDYFRKKMSAALLEVMNLLEQHHLEVDASHKPATTPRDLKRLRESATIILFRLMFLLEVERRGLLYRSHTQRRYALTELMEAYSVGDSERSPGAILERVQSLSLSIRRGDDYELALSGASIFSNRPNEGFLVDELTPWLEPFDALDVSTMSQEQRDAWDSALHKAGAVSTGQLEGIVQLANERMGGGGAAHAHRILGDIYEQILSLVPSRKKPGKGETTGKLSLGVKGGKKDERSALGAHYTPAELVEEIVRPALGHLFRQAWEDSQEDTLIYMQKVAHLHICDPAMGSAHFLTVAALEIARELAWVEFNGEPRDFAWHEPMYHPNPIGDALPDGVDPLDRKDDSHFALLVPPVYGGQGDELAFTARVLELLPSVVQECVYGVDVNPLASELGKLSLWLFTLTSRSGTEDKLPELTFLDGNIKCGNSLVGLTFDDARDILTRRLGVSFPEGTLEMFAGQGSLQTRWLRVEQYDKIMRLPEKNLREEAESFPNVVAGLDLTSAYANVIRERYYQHALELLESTRWIYDLALLTELHDYKLNTKKGDEAWLKLLNGAGANLTLEDLQKDAALWQTLLHEPMDTTSDRIIHLRQAIEVLASAIPSPQSDYRPIHWELAFPTIFPLHQEQRGFDALVANPPFVGDRKLRGFTGTATLNFLKSHYLDGAVSDLCGFFFRHYDFLVHDRGVASSIAPNTLAQAKNRREAIVPLITGDDPPFSITRARKSEEWPGQASVYICTILFVRKRTAETVYARFDQKQALDQWERVPISSYLDIYPETEFYQLPSMREGLCYTGYFMRGEFFLPVQPDQTLQQAIASVPVSERTSLYAYLNNREVQQQVVPEPSRVAIDFYDDLKNVSLDNATPKEQLEWLEVNRPTLLSYLSVGSDSVKEIRAELHNAKYNLSHKAYWWLFANTRPQLRERSSDLNNYLIFGRVSKTWAPSFLNKFEHKTGLSWSPTEQLFVSPIQQKAFFATLTSILFESHMRREASTLETRVRVTPTDSIPVFPLPWKSQWDATEGRPFIKEVPAKLESTLGAIVDRLLAHRQDILEHPTKHKIPKKNLNSQWGPTKLYNLYDSPTCKNASIVALRKMHEELLSILLDAYGWSDLERDMTWVFDVPWIDRTTRYVPDTQTRRALFDRLAKLNIQRYREELRLYIPHVVALMTVNTKAQSTKQIRDMCKEANIDIQESELEDMLHLASHGSRTTFKVRKDKKGRWIRMI